MFLNQVTFHGVDAKKDPKTGDVTLSFECRDMSEDQHTVLEELFPNTRSMLNRLLSFESLIERMKS